MVAYNFPGSQYKVLTNLQGFPGTFFQHSRLDINNKIFFDPPFIRRKRGIKECSMTTVIKLVLALLGTIFAWLIGGYTLEYFRPYRKK